MFSGGGGAPSAAGPSLEASVVRTLDCVLRAASCVLTSPHLTVLRPDSTSDARKRELRPLPLYPLDSGAAKAKMREAKRCMDSAAATQPASGKGERERLSETWVWANQSPGHTGK
ncbi:uncharacterized protein CLUP02_01404 [Colletotrichum lupini]|uniref:Uncharacterized protein n=1 Tax=Colletotrichum lupini TaxID=145971 RepID=A0A9Q8W9N7_9PEZI|nr:uncharacterized protein CLUP02_01404 [Colletotrichum lupini]UQC74752.1 hypothetical protein CLUP02_01404 [Colletotrichum lupini]